MKGLKLRMGVQWACSVARLQTWVSFPVQGTGNDGLCFSKLRLASSKCSGCPCAWSEKHLKGGQVDFSLGFERCSRGRECPVVAGTGGGSSLHDADQEAEGLAGKQGWVVTMPISPFRPLSHSPRTSKCSTVSWEPSVQTREPPGDTSPPNGDNTPHSLGCGQKRQQQRR